MKRYNIIFIINCSFLLCILTSPVLSIPSYSAEDVWVRINSTDPPLVIDVRPYEAYFESHVPTAINLPISDGVNESIVNQIVGYERSEMITVCSCTDGYQAMEYAEKLIEFGLSNVYYAYDNFLYWPYDTVSGNNPGTISKQNTEKLNNMGLESSNTGLGPFVIISVVMTIIIIIGIWGKKR